MKRCWYCHKPLKGMYDLVVTINGDRRPVCHDDRNCKPGMGIKCWGKRPTSKKRPKNGALHRQKERGGVDE